MASLLNADCRIKVSSVLNRETSLYGKQFLTDNSEETCWNSEAGTPQFIVVDFGRKVQVDTIQLMFQGGFPVPECGETSRIKIVFESSTDFFGRITVYKLDILGRDI
ncbi:Nuclear receptor 2C2-associated protein [Dissophora globulifera]|uniref:Nuclear receptor 2C2-associated protein n=1 Tax=Dissophora globulifera TaxID=979702 RepID=A0A9P6UZ52_9FUNG|nr:Nuclear receptor 2C2-associated protein [Dissophora globulifera]